MKKLILIVLVFGTLQALGKDNACLKGKITNPISDSITVSPMTASVPYQPGDHSVRLDKDGNFKVTFEVPEGYTHVRILHGNQETELIVQQGADLALTLDANNFDSTLHYEGKGKELANFMAQHVLEMQPIEMQGQMLADKELKEFEAALKELEENELSFLEENGKKLPSGFSDYFKAEVRFSAYSVMEKYPEIHEMIKQKSMNVKKIPAENYAIISDIPEEFNDSYINMPSYQGFITNLFFSQISKARADQNLAPELNSIDTTLTMAYNHMPPKTAAYYAATCIYINTKLSPIELVEQEYEAYKKHFPQSPYLTNLKQAISFKKTIADGKPAFDFDIVTPEGKKMKLSDLKGNVVYIDFWSSGCVPCLAEMPDAKKVREHFTDKQVKFVYVSLDIDDAAWQKAIKRFNVDAINTRVDKQYESEAAQKYGVYGTPSHFLIDEDGNFASTDGLARPSDPEKLIAQIQKLLK